MLAELDRRATRVRLILLGHLGVLRGNGKALLNGWRGTLRPPFEKVTRLVENPRLTKRAARNHDPSAIRMAMHPYRILSALDISIAKHRDIERVDDRRDLIPAR